MLSNLPAIGDIVGLHLPFGGQLVVQALVDELALASWLNINWRKSRLIFCTKIDLERLDVCVIWATSHEVGQARHLTTSLWLCVFCCYILQNRGNQQG